MAKSKVQTPQEIYRERKLREEREKTAYLPSGLINHGNTCFMNSVLQGLIATRLLSDLVHFSAVPAEIQRTAATPIVSRRSPQLTNGHNLAGPYEQEWVDTMPIGDMFLVVLYKAWDSQATRKRDVLSPKSLLATLGQKYDQYLDFAQQDAHEFLRILLDAMRMEEQDIIKKRQPPPPSNHHKKRRRTVTAASHRLSQPQSQPPLAKTSLSDPTPPSSLSTPETVTTISQPNGDAHTKNPDDDTHTSTTNTTESHPLPLPAEPDLPLISFVDMIFGGQLTSILVCQKCKHVSQTYEDFNDISLSIKAEDYLPQNRKRDRLRKIVGRLSLGYNLGKEKDKEKENARDRDPLRHAAMQLRAADTRASISSALEIQRSSSVPPSPSVETRSPLGSHDEDERHVAEFPRRRSLDVGHVGSRSPESSDMKIPVVETSNSEGNPPILVVNGKAPVSEKGTETEAAQTIQTLESHGEHSHLIVSVSPPAEDNDVELVEHRKEKENEKPAAGLAFDKEKDVDVSNPSSGKPREDSEDVKDVKEGKRDDGWAKIGRRISLTVGLGWQKDKEKGKKDRDRKARSMGGMIKELVSEADTSLGMQKSSTSATSSLLPSTADVKKRLSMDGPSTRTTMASNASKPSSSAANAVASTSSLVHQDSKPLPPRPPPSTISDLPATSDTSSHPPANTTSFTSASSSQTPHHLLSSPANVSTSIFPNVQRSRSPKPPKPTAAETEYLRKILADVAASSSNNPFAIFKPPLLHSHSSYHPTSSLRTVSAPSTMAPSSAGGGLDKEKDDGQEKEREKERSAATGPGWLGMGKSFSGLEECLRLFTAVEVLDGENMVGCRRCWKIQNGVYQPKEKQDDSDDDEEERTTSSIAAEPGSMSVEDDPGGTLKNEDSLVNTGASTSHKALRPPLYITASPSSLSSTGGGAVQIPTSISTPTVSFYSQVSASDSTRSVSSLPTEATSISLLKEGEESGDYPLTLSVITEASTTSTGPGGFPIPVISTTAPPDTPFAWSSSVASLGDTSSPNHGVSVPTASKMESTSTAYSSSSAPVPHPRVTQAVYDDNASSPYGSKDSLVIPRIRPRYQKKSYTDTTTDNDSSDGDEDSDTSVGTSNSAGSSPADVNMPSHERLQAGSVNGITPKASPPVPVAPSSSIPQPESASAPVQPKKPSKPPKPVIMRPAYKRYLIATPPPVLVIHLKRFQQTSKVPLMSFSHGFKKLDDTVSFPEYLDLLPFLAPRKEDYGLGKKKERRLKAKEERCMYRLYAVVVHIGNMLGGHYVAYAALPADLPIRSHPSSESEANGGLEKEKGQAKAEPPPAQQQPQSRAAERQWAYISDTVVRLTTLEDVLRAKAYICMYERC